jgi:hypothetical protein
MTKMKNLYNQDGSLYIEAQLILSGKPTDTPIREWRNRVKDFHLQLSPSDLKEFKRLKNTLRNIKWRAFNSKKVKDINLRYRSNNPQKSKECNTNWRNKNYTHILSYSNEYQKQRKATDPVYRLQHSMRRMTSRVVKQLSLGKKPTCTKKWQGCTAEELKTYLESLFTEGMTWDNYGEWHIDHIRPVSSFSAEEWEQINHYSNLQPLWAKDNLSKGDSWTGQFPIV